jgi:predicted ATPase
MISEIQFPSLQKSKTFAYAADVAFFKANKSVVLKPGLNIFFGPNGCGKSSILRMAGLSLAAEQGGVSTVTRSWLGDVYDYDGTSKLEGINVVHDGQPILYGNPRNAVGLFGGQA